VKVHCDEGVAIHVAPDPCAGVREGVGEASAGERIGQPLTAILATGRLEPYRPSTLRRGNEVPNSGTPSGVVQQGREFE
jgi:hypothetical protein